MVSQLRFVRVYSSTYLTAGYGNAIWQPKSENLHYLGGGGAESTPPVSGNVAKYYIRELAGAQKAMLGPKPKQLAGIHML